MGDSIEERNKKRVQKHQMLQEFATVKKSYLVSFLLCWVLGSLGVHRFYLGQKNIGLAIAAFFVVLMAAIFFFSNNAQDGLSEKFLPFIGAYAVFMLIELFFIPRTTERVNTAIKEELKKKYYT